MIGIYRFFRHPDSRSDYYFGTTQPWTPDYQEWLGCIWAP